MSDKLFPQTSALQMAMQGQFTRDPMLEAITNGLRPAFEIQDKMKNLISPFEQISKLNKLVGLSAFEELSAQNRNYMDEVLKPFKSAIHHDTSFLNTVKSINELSDVFRSSLKPLIEINNEAQKLVEMLKIDNSFIKAIESSNSWQNNFKSLFAELSPSLEALRKLNSQAVSAYSNEFTNGFENASFLIEESEEANRLFASIASSSTTEEAIGNFAGFFAFFEKIYYRLSENTKIQVSKYGIFEWLNLFLMVFALWQIFASELDEKSSKEIKQQIVDVNKSILTLNANFEQLSESLHEQNAMDISSLPRGLVAANSNIRIAPDPKAKVIFKQKNENIVAIRGESGRWISVVFRDPLTDSLTHGWIYSRFLKPLDE